MKCNARRDLVPRLRISGALPLIHLYAFEAWKWAVVPPFFTATRWVYINTVYGDYVSFGRVELLCFAINCLVLHQTIYSLACYIWTERDGPNRNVVDRYSGVSWFVSPSATVLYYLDLLPVTSTLFAIRFA